MNISRSFHWISSGLSWLATAIIALASALSINTAQATNDPSRVSFTLEGCRNNGTITLPINGQFICPDSAYTTGNLGKGWNELDLVPFRITTKAGNSAPPTQTYAVAIALDHEDTAHPGFDVLASDNQPSGAPVLNTALSDASCTALSSTGQQILSPGIGGIDKTLYRILTITQAQNTTCVYDWYGRLALGSHLWPGSSLHANLLNQDLSTGGIGAKEVSIPVKDISPQDIHKDMSATQSANYAWNLTKSADPSSIAFGDVCANDFSDSQPVTIRVEWTKLSATPGNITVITNIYANNPASRTITVKVTDKLYQGITQNTLLGSVSSNEIDIPAKTETMVFTHVVTLPNTDGSVGDYLNDVATAQYIDNVTNVPIPGETVATASAQITSGAVTNNSADISDTESITGDGLSFAVAVPTLGDFLNGYIAGTETIGPVGWQVLGQTASGNVDFDKTVYLDGKRITSGTLSDTATLQAGDFSKSVGPLNVTITSSASATLTFSKTIPNTLDTGEKIEVTFHIARANDPSYSLDKTFTFIGGGSTTQSMTLTGLVPDNYTVTETGSVFYPAGCNDSSCSLANPLVSDNPSKTADLSADVTGIITNCSATLEFTNRLRQEDFAKAKVSKVTTPTLLSTDPDYEWTFTLTGPGLNGGITATANAGEPAVSFATDLVEGTYTVVETTKPEWDLANVVNPDGSSPNPIVNSCSFTVDYPEDYDKTFTCTFSNTKRGKAAVEKTVSGQPITGTDSFTFQLRQGASTTADGTVLEIADANVGNGGSIAFSTLLIPGHPYQLCESVMPGWNTNLGTYGTLFVPNSFITPILPNPDVNNMAICVDFTVNPGETKSFAVDNTPPPGGFALTIGFWKNWSSCSNSNGHQDWTLDETLASFSGGGVLIGKLFVDTCEEAKALLDKRDLSGKKRASDAGFNLAAQLLAYRLNIQAGSYSCGVADTAATNAQSILWNYGFDGYKLAPKSVASALNNYAKTLDDYNNNKLCGMY